MAKIVLFCRETPGLTLGPNNEIQFRGGFAEVDDAATPSWEDWINHAGTPFIRKVKGGMPSENETRCPICGDAQSDAAALASHYGGEHPAKPVPVQPPDQKPVFAHEVGGTPVLVQPPAEPLPVSAEPQLIFPAAKGGGTSSVPAKPVATGPGAAGAATSKVASTGAHDEGAHVHTGANK